MITGNWIVANLGADNRDFGFFPLPPMTAGAPPVSTGGAGFPLAITAGVRASRRRRRLHRLDDERPRERPARAGRADPAARRGSDARRSSRARCSPTWSNAASDVSKANGVVPYEDWATPTFYDTLTAAIQELMAERITPQEFVAKVQQDYADFQSSEA